LPVTARRLLILVAVVAVGCGGSKEVTIESNSVVLLRGHDVVADVPVQGPAARITYGDGAFWAAVPDRGAVYRIDEGSQDVRRIKLGVRPFDAALGEGAFWVPDHDTRSLFRVDLESKEVTDAMSLGEGGVEVGVGFSSIWVVLTSGRLLRIDPKTLKVTGTVPDAATTAEGMEPKLAFAPDAVWSRAPPARRSHESIRARCGSTPATLAAPPGPRAATVPSG
jgi:streptogramin lyase